MPPKRGWGAVEGEDERGGGGGGETQIASVPRPLDTTPAGGGGPKAALWGLGAHAATRRQHALNTWAILRAAGGRGDPWTAAAAAAVALRAPVPGVEGEAAIAGVPPGWAALVTDPAASLPHHPAALTGAGRAAVLGMGIDALRATAAAKTGGVGKADLVRCARARVAAAPPVTPSHDAAALGLALELASAGDTPQALAVLEASAAAAAAAAAVAATAATATTPTTAGPTLSRPRRPDDPATLSTLASLRYATWEAGRRGDGVAAGAALVALERAVGGGCASEAATLAAALHLWAGGGGPAALGRAAAAASDAVTAAPRDADAAGLRLVLMGGEVGGARAGAALHLLRCSPRSGRALAAVLASTDDAKAVSAPLRAEAGALFLEALGGRGAAGSACASRAARAAWLALAGGASDLLAGVAGGSSSSSSSSSSDEDETPANRPPPPADCAAAVAALRARAKGWGGPGGPFDPATLPSDHPHRRPLGAYALADRGVAAAILGTGPGGAAFVERVLALLDRRVGRSAVEAAAAEDAAPAAAKVRRALDASGPLDPDLPPPWGLRLPGEGGSAAGAPLPQRTHPERGRLRGMPSAWWAGSFPPSLLRREGRG